MNATLEKTIENELKMFASRNFTAPSECKNVEQVRFYMEELRNRMKYMEQHFNYVPSWAYQLLSQYDARQKSLMPIDIKNSHR